MRYAFAFLLFAAAAGAAIRVDFQEAQTETGPSWRIDLRAGTGPGTALTAVYDCESRCTSGTTDRSIQKHREVRSYGAASRNACLLALDAKCTAGYVFDAGAP